MTQAKPLENEEKEECFDEEEEEMHVPRKPGEAPDGKWGWVVVFGTFLCCLFVNGLQFSYRAFEMEISNSLHIPQESVAYVGNLMTCFSFIGGPLAYIQVKRFGCRKVVMGGSCVTFVALLASSWAPSLTALHITYGVLAGFGCSLIYLPSIMIVALWFHDKRAFATGLALTGSGVGVFMFPPFCKHLLENHSWRNALVIMSAFFLNCAAAGTLFRPLIYVKPKSKKCNTIIQHGAIMKALIAEKERQRTISNGSLDNCIITKDNILIRIDKNDLRNKSISYLNWIKETLGFSSRSLNGCRSKSSLTVPKVLVDPCNSKLLPAIKLNTLKIHPSIKQLPASTPPTPKRDSGIASLNDSPKSKSCEALPTGELLVVSLPYNKQMASLSASHISNIDKVNNLDFPGNFEKKMAHLKVVLGLLSNPATPERRRHNADDRFRTISNSSTHSKTPSISIPGSVLSIPNIHPINYAEDVITDVSLCRKIYWWLDLGILKLFTFWLLSLSSFCTMLGYVITQVHLLEKASILGMTEEGTNFMISIFWVVHMLGRCTLGWISDRPWTSAVQLNNLMILLAGIVSCFSIKYTSGSLLDVYAALFGICTASYFALQSIISIELFGEDRFPCALGLISFFQGLSILAGYKLSNLLHGYSDTAICIAGGCMLVSALLGFPLRKVQQWEGRKNDCALKIVQIDEIQNGSESEILMVENCESTI